jgi:hypothetical protein
VGISVSHTSENEVVNQLCTIHLYIFISRLEVSHV